jgi:hypothetical protein
MGGDDSGVVGITQRELPMEMGEDIRELKTPGTLRGRRMEASGSSSTLPAATDRSPLRAERGHGLA